MNRQPLYAATILRISLGLVYLSHGLLKLVVFTPTGTAGFFESLGLPSLLGPITMAVEIVGGLLLIVGFKSAIVAMSLVPILVGSILWVHGANGWGFSNEGGGWEYPAFLALCSIAVFLSGNGVFAIESVKQGDALSSAAE